MGFNSAFKGLRKEKTVLVYTLLWPPPVCSRLSYALKTVIGAAGCAGFHGTQERFPLFSFSQA